MKTIHKIWKFISSMQFAIGLLLILAVACSVGSVITQGQTYEIYAQQYGERAAGAIIALQLDDLFHSWWFIVLSSFLCLNLILCNLIRMPRILKQMKADEDPSGSVGKTGGVSISGITDPEGLFKAMGFTRVQTGEMSLPAKPEISQADETAAAAADSDDMGTPDAALQAAAADTTQLCESETSVEEGKNDSDMCKTAAASAAGSSADSETAKAAAESAAPGTEAGSSEENSSSADSRTASRSWKYSVKNRAGLWGAWVCHLGILLLILGFGLGQATKEDFTVYGLPGDSLPVGDTGCILTIDSFDVALREDDTVEQYTAGITVRRPSDGAEKSAEISVNNPASIFGMKFYQNSTGWAADMHVLKDGEPLQDSVIYAGDYVEIEDLPTLDIYLNAFYPDYVLDPELGPMSASSALKNPAYLYFVYYQNQMIGMNALLQSEELTIDEYTVTFDNPRNFTLIQVKRDRFTYLALIGGLVVMFGLILAFYIQEAKIWAVREDDGTWTVRGASRKGGVLYYDQLKEEAEKFKKAG